MIIDARNRNNFDHSVSLAEKFKNDGNEFLRNNDYHRAVTEYEKSLSLFDWIEPVDGDESWKKAGIDDEKLRYKSLVLRTNDVAKVHNIKVSCILNLALSFLKLSQWSNCIDACNAVILFDYNGGGADNKIDAFQSSDVDDHDGKTGIMDKNDSHNTFKGKATAKALYRRAQARLIPIISSYNEEEDYRLALADLKAALELQPEDHLIRKDYLALVDLLKKQKQSQSKTFKKILPKHKSTYAKDVVTKLPGEVDKSAQEVAPMSYAEAENILKGLESSLQVAQRNDEEDAVADLSERVTRIKSLLAEAKSGQTASSFSKVEMDFTNPSDEMIQEAKETTGLDLTNKRTQRMLSLLQQNAIKNRVNKNNKEAAEKKKKQSGDDYCDSDGSEEELVTKEAYEQLQLEEANEISTHIVSQLMVVEPISSYDEKRKEAAYWQENIHLFESLLTNRWGHVRDQPVALKERFESLQMQLITSIRDDVVLYYKDNEEGNSNDLTTKVSLYDFLTAKYKFAAPSPRGFTFFIQSWFSALVSFGGRFFAYVIVGMIVAVGVFAIRHTMLGMKKTIF